MQKYTIIQISASDTLCIYGCGCVAKYKTLKGVPMCESHRNKCPVNRAKNSFGLSLAYKTAARKPATEVYKSLPKKIKEKMAWSKGKTAVSDKRVAKFVNTRKINYAAGKFTLSLRGFAKNDNMRWKRIKFNRVDSYNNSVVLESKNEIIFAELLDKHNIKWCRPSYKELSTGKRYTPDFYLPDYNLYCDPKSVFWIEHFKSKQIEKIKFFEKEYNTKVLIFWDTERCSWEKVLTDLKMVGVEGVEPSIQ